MKNKILSIVDTTKKRVGTIALCGALVTALSAGTVFAASSADSPQVKTENAAAITSIGAALENDGAEGILSKTGDGIRNYSTDDGKAWSKEAPINMENSVAASQLANDGITGLQIKVENGVMFYSTDEGRTWSQNVPAGVTVNEQNGVSITNEIPPVVGETKGTLSKVEDGAKAYSTDGGKTWSKDAPANAKKSETIGID